MLHSEIDRLFPIVIENYFTEETAGGIVHVDNGFIGSSQSLERSSNKIFPCWCEDLHFLSQALKVELIGTHLNPYIVGYLIFLNELSHKVEVSVTRGGVRNFDLLESALE
jgi:hypothetical protein